VTASGVESGEHLLEAAVVGADHFIRLHAAGSAAKNPFLIVDLN
jgi:hypothetical protein